MDGETPLPAGNGWMVLKPTVASSYTISPCRFHNGKRRHHAKPLRCRYEETYTVRSVKSHALFPRGIPRRAALPDHWAGDQASTFDEMRAVLGAGLSLGLSGVRSGVSISGVCRPAADAELYLRSTAMAAFAPVMQWHSEPLGGSSADLTRGWSTIAAPGTWRCNGRRMTWSAWRVSMRGFA